MIRKNRHGADLGALALAASLLFSGVFVAGSAPALAASTVTGTTGSAMTAKDSSQVVTYVALGDSYAAGQGVPPYDNACLQSDASYPEVLDDVKHVKLVADASCSGAKTADVRAVQLPALTKTRKVDLVSLTIGANDLNGPAVAAACSVSFGSAECQAGLAGVNALLTPPAPTLPSELAARLGATFTAVTTAVPGARILVTGYPYLFETMPETDPGQAAVGQLNDLTAALNTNIQGAVRQLAKTGTDIRYVDVTDAFIGHGIGSADPWINSAGIDEALHPTAAGHQAYAVALQEAFPRNRH